MKISYNWLKNYVEINKTANETAEILTSLGLETGSIEEFETIKGGLKGLVIGKVLSCEKHPNADKLTVTTVDVGDETPLNIVCGAPNVKSGQKVVVAKVDTILYKDNEKFTIKKSKIRGELSEGMICAEDEIGIGSSHEGILVLNDDAIVGTSAAQYFKTETDTIFEIDLTPNRIDAASHIGIARDLVAKLSLTNPDIKIKYPSVDDFEVDNQNFPVKISIENVDACPRYSGVTISDLKIDESPDWLKNRLKSIGLTPINNVVDITNFVLHECGQPLHAFDGDKIEGNHIIVKTLPEGTPFVTLDGKKRELSTHDLMICNQTKPMCIAGVFGGIESGVSEQTTKIFLESACFNPIYIRKTSRKHQLFTDASFRFERGSDPNITIFALKRAATLIKEVAGGFISSDIVDVYPNPIKNIEIKITFDYINRLIGKEIEKRTLKQTLNSLEITIVSETYSHLLVSVPPYRVDVTREADIVEEILRVFGYNNIEFPEKLNSSVVYSTKPDFRLKENIISSQLIGAGFREIMSNSLTKATYYENSNTYPKSQSIELANPLSADLNVMRQTLLFGGLEAIERNKNRQRPDLKFFEFGNCYFDNQGNKSYLNNYPEFRRLALFMTGLNFTPNWNTPAKEVSFFDIKTHCENILQRLNINKNIFQINNANSDIFSDGLEYSIQNKTILTIGIVDVKLLKMFDINSDVYFAEFSWDNIVKMSDNNSVAFNELPKFPEVRRDLALLVDHSLQFSEIEQIAFRTEKKFLKRIALFDVYTGEKIPKEKKSYAVSFFLEDKTNTLNDKQIERIMSNLTQAFNKELGAELRG
ncbi:MAG: phenylalanine--tRNA ligase subunit beta [Marinilabiliaceae bacterium]|nr:phenylalanine--tRNA ligase subunit beta [Marinilabiliaceae bacterium]